MENTPYVSDVSLKLADDMEKRFLGLGKSSGIIFISVAPVPVEDGDSDEFMVAIGIDRKFSEGTVIALAKTLFSRELEDGITLNIMPIRGSCGPASDSINIH